MPLKYSSLASAQLSFWSRSLAWLTKAIPFYSTVSHSPPAAPVRS